MILRDGDLIHRSMVDILNADSERYIVRLVRIEKDHAVIVHSTGSQAITAASLNHVVENYQHLYPTPDSQEVIERPLIDLLENNS